MTEWHCEWQGNFPLDQREVPFVKKCLMFKKRRADVVLLNDYILEIQHSKISKNEVDNRKMIMKFMIKKSSG